MGKALLFPGQAAQFVGMGSTISKQDSAARELLSLSDDILGYPLSEIMFEGPVERLTETQYTQPAVFVHSMLIYYRDKSKAEAIAVAGHSLGEISACVAAGVLSYEDGLRLVHKRALAMQKACDLNPGTMAAVLSMEDEAVEAICDQLDGVVPANYNCPGQLVISGTKEGILSAIDACKEAGARRAMEIAVGGAFHSPLMEPAMAEFKEAIDQLELSNAKIPVFQNVDAQPHTNAAEIKKNLINQVVNPVRWTETIQQMMKSGIDQYVEVGGKGRILQGMLRKISRDIDVTLWQEE